MWSPKSESDILSAISEGTFSESHFLDAKATTGSSDGERKETARDLASFALDGGALVIGVAEDKQDRSFVAAPIALAGLAEKLEQIASTRIDPPLSLRVTEIMSSADAKLGYLYVEIPASPLAPHMADNIYYARGEKTKRRMSDAEVVRLHRLREGVENRISADLNDLIESDPLPLAKRNYGHLYLVARPVNASRNVAQAVVREDSNSRLFSIRGSTEHLIKGPIRDWAPRPEEAFTYVSRSKGSAFTTVRGGQWDPAQDREDSFVDIEFREDGSIRVIVGRMTDSTPSGMAILDGIAVAYCIRLVGWAMSLAEQTTYRGAWSFGIAANGLRGIGAYESRSRGAYDVDLYEEVTSATLSEIEDNGTEVVNRLIGGLLRGLGTSKKYDYLTDRDN